MLMRKTEKPLRGRGIPAPTGRDKNVAPTYCVWRFVILCCALSSTTHAQMARSPLYRPPVANAPVVRVDGHTRGGDDVILTLTVLAPEHVGLTTHEQPCLFWCQSRTTKSRFELTISQPRKSEPLVEVKLDEPQNDGIRQFCLAEHNVRLKPDVEYRWTVALVVDPENRSKDVIASGAIKRVAPSASLTKRLEGAPTTEQAFIFADEGFWYDSMQALSNQIDQQPEQKALREQRGIFFLQVGLPEAARHEFRMAGVTKTSK